MNIVHACIGALSSEALNGAWKLRTNAHCASDTGRIDGWSLTFRRKSS